MPPPAAALSAAVAASLVLMYAYARTTATSFLWLSAFTALAAFFVRVGSTIRAAGALSDQPTYRHRVSSIVACTVVFATLLYSLALLGPVRFLIVAAAAAGIPSINRCRKNSRLAKSICTVLCCLVVAAVPDPAQASTPSFLFGMIGVGCVGAVVHLVRLEIVKSVESSSLLCAAALLAAMGLMATLVQSKPVSGNETASFLLFCLATTIFIVTAAWGVPLQATAVTLASSSSGLLVASFLVSVNVFPSSTSWSLAAFLVSLVFLFLAHKGLSFADSGSSAAGSQSFNPAQLFKKSQKRLDDSGLIQTLLSNPRERKLFIFLLLTVAIMLLEFLYGVAVNSLGLISDSFHMMLDGTSIAIGLYAAHASSWRADQKTHPFGYARYEVFGGFVNGVLLLFIALYVMVESVQRILDPPEIEGPYLLLVSVIGLVVNIIGIVFFHDSHGHSHSHSHGDGHDGHVDHNMRGVYLHILADLLGSVSVIISSVIIYFVGWWVADPICSALSAILILLSAFPLLEETGKVLILSAPEYKRNYSDELRGTILEQSVLQDVASLKIWVHSTSPRDLTICTVAGKIRGDVDYATARRKVLEVVTNHLTAHLDAHNVSVIIHLE